MCWAIWGRRNAFCHAGFVCTDESLRSMVSDLHVAFMHAKEALLVPLRENRVSAGLERMTWTKCGAY